MYLPYNSIKNYSSLLRFPAKPEFPEKMPKSFLLKLEFLLIKLKIKN